MTDFIMSTLLMLQYNYIFLPNQTETVHVTDCEPFWMMALLPYPLILSHPVCIQATLN